MKEPRIRGEAPQPEERGFPLSGEFNIRLLRGIQAAMGYDPTQKGTGIVEVAQYVPKIAPEILVADLTGPPFRKNGRGFGAVATLPPGALGTFSTLLFKNQPPAEGNRLDVIVLDSIAVGGSAADFAWGFCLAAGAFLPIGVHTEHQHIDVQPPAAGVSTARTPRPEPLRFASFYAAALFNNGVDADYAGLDGNNAAGQHTKVTDLGICLWPGVVLFIQHRTADTQLNVSLKGRIVNLGEPGQSF